jgi:hypothetical protein
MNRAEAVEVLLAMSAGLTATPDDVAKLLERASTSDAPELLRSLLTEYGAQALLEGVRNAE